MVAKLLQVIYNLRSMLCPSLQASREGGFELVLGMTPRPLFFVPSRPASP
jgi:hypothetical protein